MQISTGSACHLDAHMVHSALHELDLSDIDILFIENVGNLVCPASFDLGQHRNVTLLSTPEGDDKPAKYPVMFRSADLVLISKSDLLQVLEDFDPGSAADCLRGLANPAPLLQLSAKSGAGMRDWLDWVAKRSRNCAARTIHDRARGGSRRLNTPTAQQWLSALRELAADGPVRIMNVCGGHERSISIAGLRTAIPSTIELIPGPGCPVCICPEEDVFEAIQLALNEDIILVAFGDMLRVPVNVPKREPRSLEQARAAGGDIRPIASPTEAVRIATENPSRKVVFFAAGFETTTAPVAAMLAEGVPDNLLVLLSGRLTWPAVAMLLESGSPGFDALIAPGHVSTVMGPEEWAVRRG